MKNTAIISFMFLLTPVINLLAQSAQDTITASDLYEGRSDIVAGVCVRLVPGFHAAYGSATHAYIDNVTPPPANGYHPVTGDIAAVGDSPSAVMNYIKMTTMRVPVASESLAEQAARTVEIEYFDPFGARLATMEVKGSPNRRDIVRGVVKFDIGNRVEREYLPYESEDADGSWPDDILGDVFHFYSDGGLTGCDADLRPWTTPKYDGTPMNRSAGEVGVGEAWQGHRTYIVRGCNPAAFSLWKAKPDGSWPQVSYPAGSLFYEARIDEDGFETRSYIDNRGRTVLEQSMGDGSGTALRTAYVYDDLGRLRCVVPPGASSPSDTSLCHYYTYDTDGRVIEKKVPGGGMECFVYDRRHRQVMTQDANLRGSHEWAFTMYDALGRVVLCGYTGCTLNRQQLQALFDTQGTVDEQWSPNGALHGYSGASFPATLGVTQGLVKSANWYDGYGFLGLFPSGYGCPDDPSGAPVAYDQRTRGALTGSMEKAELPSGDVAMLRVYYYDAENRLVCTVGDNHLGGRTDRFVRYNFSGQPVEEYTAHKIAGQDTLVTRSRYTYDHAGRCLQEFYRIGCSDDILARAYEYNEVGDPLNVYLHSPDSGACFNQRLRRHHNIRGWLTGVNDFGDPGYDLFACRLAYHTPLFSLTNLSRYNGKVSQVQSNGRYAVPSSFGFYYDDHDRLSDSYYAEGVVPQQESDRVFECYSYDDNSNLVFLNRKRDGVVIDELLYNYAGTNRVVSINDLSHSREGYRYNSGTYSYDGNGNVTYDPSRRANMVYSRLNLPLSVTVSASDWVHYSYSSTGSRLRKEVRTFGTPAAVVTDYSGEFVYEDGVLAFVATPFGRAVPDSTSEGPGWRFCYHLKDYLGNVRAEFAAHDCGQSELLQQTDYYPFGFTLRHTDYATCPNRRLFGGKELQDETLAGVTLNLYDFEARMYDPTIGRFLSVDPLADKYYGLSPFAYCGNDPMNAIDPDGKEIKLVGSEKERKIILANLQKLTNDKLSMRSDGTVIIARIGGENPGKYFKTGSELIRDLNKKGDGAKTVTISIGNNGNYESHKNSKANFRKKVDSNVTFDPSSNPLIMTKDPITNNVSKETRPSEIGLGHELIHAHRAMNGKSAQGTIEQTYKDENGKLVKKTIRIEEAETIGLQGDNKYTENKLRVEQGLKERGMY